MRRPHFLPRSWSAIQAMPRSSPSPVIATDSAMCHTRSPSSVCKSSCAESSSMRMWPGTSNLFAKKRSGIDGRARIASCLRICSSSSRTMGMRTASVASITKTIPSVVAKCVAQRFLYLSWPDMSCIV
eukprot:Amastigsp_a339564_1667.p3 type:complete len:128 gc:universal Amastigsp_a339564_1667:739-1122(+)